MRIQAPEGKLIVGIKLPQSKKEALSFNPDEQRVGEIISTGCEQFKEGSKVIYGDGTARLPLEGGELAFYVMKEENVYGTILED